MSDRFPNAPWLDPAVPTPGRSSKRAVPLELIPHPPVLLARLTTWLAVGSVISAFILWLWSLAHPLDLDSGDGLVTVILTYPPFVIGVVLGAVYYAVSSLWLYRSRQFALAVNPHHSHRLGAVWIWLGWWVPIVNLWFPYLVVSDIKEATDHGSHNRRTGWWWGLGIGSWAFGGLATVISPILSWMAALAAFGYWLALISDITNSQQSHVRAALRAAGHTV